MLSAIVVIEIIVLIALSIFAFRVGSFASTSQPLDSNQIVMYVIASLVCGAIVLHWVAMVASRRRAKRPANERT